MGKKALLLVSLLLLAILSLSFSQLAIAQEGVTAVVTNEWANIRIIPALGAEVIASMPAGYLFDAINGRSGDNQWLRVDFNGEEGWVHMSPLAVLTGDTNSLPVADPRSVPYGGFDAPRSGMTSATSEVTARLADWMNVRGGPSTGYPILAYGEINSHVYLLGRTANSSWTQINYQGTLGWIASRYLILPAGFHLGGLPVGGIVAEAQLPSRPVGDDYVSTLQLMLARINLAQPSLDEIRAAWADSSLTGRASCHDAFPARPSNFNVPNDLLAAYYVQLNPVTNLFNDAMYNVRYAIDLLIEACEQPGLENPVGQATVAGALDVVALADGQFAELRRRLAELIPDDPGIGIGQCLFSFGGQVDILPVVAIGQIVIDYLSPKRLATGYCFDAIQGQQLIFETLMLKDTAVIHLLAMSRFDDPTDFLTTGTGYITQADTVVGPITIPETARYILIVTNVEPDVYVDAEFAVFIHEPIPGVFGGSLVQDPITGVLITATPSISPFATPALGTCPDLSWTCIQMPSCETAYACLQAGNFSLDGDNDGVPCENVVCPGN